MNNITSEYDYLINKLKETRNIVGNNLLQYDQKYGDGYLKSVKVKCAAEFLDKMKNETKKITIERYNLIGEVNKVMQSSKGMIKFVRIIEFKIVLRGRIFKIYWSIF